MSFGTRGEDISSYSIPTLLATVDMLRTHIKVEECDIVRTTLQLSLDEALEELDRRNQEELRRRASLASS